MNSAGAVPCLRQSSSPALSSSNASRSIFSPAQGRQLFFLDVGCSSLAQPDPALSQAALGSLWPGHGCVQGERLMLSRSLVLPLSVMNLVRTGVSAIPSAAQQKLLEGQVRADTEHFMLLFLGVSLPVAKGTCLHRDG